MPVVRRGDRDRVELLVLEGSAHVGETLDVLLPLLLQILDHPREHLLVGVDHAGDLDVLLAGKAADVRTAAPVQAGDSDAQGVSLAPMIFGPALVPLIIGKPTAAAAEVLRKWRRLSLDMVVDGFGELAKSGFKKKPRNGRPQFGILANSATARPRRRLAVPRSSSSRETAGILRSRSVAGKIGPPHPPPTTSKCHYRNPRRPPL